MPELYISPEGNVRYVYTDTLPDSTFRREASSLSTRRASHVEPYADGGWTADMSPVGGPVLGPFALRGQALEAETAWLATYLGEQS
jgi:hypothetical protein